MSSLKEIMDRMNAMEKKLEDMVIANNAIVSTIANNIELKIDLLLNADKVLNQQKTLSNGKKVKSKSSFFKEKIKEDKEVYLNILYTKEDVDKLMELSEVKSKKGDINKISKMSEFLYKQITADTSKLSKLNEIYEEYKKKQVDADDDNVPDLEE